MESWDRNWTRNTNQFINAFKNLMTTKQLEKGTSWQYCLRLDLIHCGSASNHMWRGGGGGGDGGEADTEVFMPL